MSNRSLPVPPSRSLLLGRPRDATKGGAHLGLGDLARLGADDWSRVRGDFALGHTHADGSSVLAVDRFGMQTLCWRLTADGLRFAEHAHELGGGEIDPQALFDYLFFHVVPSPGTVGRGVQRLPPASVLRVRDGQAVLSRYWTPRFKPQPTQSLPALTAEFRQLLQAAVHEQLDGGKPGCFLSGGTDSSTVAGMVGLASGRAAATYSIGFDAEGYDEMAYARLAARHFGTEHHEYYVTPADLVAAIPQVAASYDQPFGNSSALPAYYCARMAREDGVTRILAGDGGDELFGGNARYAKQKVFALYDRLPGPLRALAEPLLLNPLAQTLPGLRKGASYVQQARLGLPARLETYNLLHRIGVQEILTPAFLRLVDIESPPRQQAAVWAEPGEASLLNRQLAFDWRYTLAETDLPKVRGTTRLAGLAVGYPMLDQRLVDFSLRLSDDHKLKGKQLRWFFKEALRGFLPDEIITKKKQGFGLPFGPWLLRDQALHELAAGSLADLAARGVVNAAFTDSLMRVRLREHPAYYGEMVWILMMLEQWLQARAPGFRVGHGAAAGERASP
jgi:asparagine synthase (glutamine-hydrolysing)